MLKFENVTYAINDKEKEKAIIKNISFEIEDNELIIITGQNGSGKSTLAKLIVGILEPTSGKIIFNGQDITKYSITQRANLGISYAFQQPVIFKGITVKKLVDIATRKKNTTIEACEILSKVGLCAKQYLDRQVDSKLSGGELKRIEIASVLARDTKFNVFDEPEAGIDLWSFNFLIKNFENKNKTNIVISHQSKLINLADKIMLLNNGKIEKFGPKDEILPYLNPLCCNKLRRTK